MRMDASSRTVVTPPHLPAKMNGFYAPMRQVLGAARRGLRGDRWPDSSMHFYAPWLCRLALSLCAPSRGSMLWFEAFEQSRLLGARGFGRLVVPGNRAF